MTVIPFCAALAAASLAGALNPSGWIVIFTFALPGALAAFGLTQMDHFAVAAAIDSSPAPGNISRSWEWILSAIVLLALFVGVLGPGTKFGPNF